MEKGEIKCIGGILYCYNCSKGFINKEDIDNHLKRECILDEVYNAIYFFKNEELGHIYFASEIAGEIYILQTEQKENVYKIGISKDITNRIVQYVTGRLYHPRLKAYYLCADIKEADKIMKQKLKKYQIKNEMYGGKIEDIEREILDILQIINKGKIIKIIPHLSKNDVIECNFCEKKFGHQKYLEDHKKKCEKYSRNIEEPNNDIGDKINGESFQNLKKININLNVYEKKYSCKFCGKNYSSGGNLGKHKPKCKIMCQINKDQQFNKKIEELKKKIEELEKKNEFLEKKVDLLEKEKRIFELEKELRIHTLNYNNNANNNDKNIPININNNINFTDSKKKKIKKDNI